MLCIFSTPQHNDKSSGLLDQPRCCLTGQWLKNHSGWRNSLMELNQAFFFLLLYGGIASLRTILPRRKEKNRLSGLTKSCRWFNLSFKTFKYFPSSRSLSWFLCTRRPVSTGGIIDLNIPTALSRVWQASDTHRGPGYTACTAPSS